MRVVITSVGAVTGHGLGIGPLLSAVLEGRSAIAPVTRFSTVGLCSNLAAEAPPSAQLRAAAAGLEAGYPVDRASQLLFAAAAEALSGRGQGAQGKRGVVVGTTKGAFGSDAPDALGSCAVALGRAVRARGPVFTVSSACASSTAAAGEALALLQEGHCDEVLVGGTEALHAFVYRGFHALKAMSPAPAAPFDVDRSGLSLGEGAAVLVLEPLERALAEGRVPLAEVEGFGASTDGHDQTAPDPRGGGLLRACRGALKAADLEAGDIDRYHAHGTGTFHNDRMEAQVHAALFAGRPVPVCGIKGSTGHTLGASGALDLLVCALTLQQRWLPPVTHLRRLDQEAPLPAVMGAARRCSDERALVVSAGFGGVNAAVVLRRGREVAP